MPSILATIVEDALTIRVNVLHHMFILQLSDGLIKIEAQGKNLKWGLIILK